MHFIVAHTDALVKIHKLEYRFFLENWSSVTLLGKTRNLGQNESALNSIEKRKKNVDKGLV